MTNFDILDNTETAKDLIFAQSFVHFSSALGSPFMSVTYLSITVFLWASHICWSPFLKLQSLNSDRNHVKCFYEVSLIARSDIKRLKTMSLSKTAEREKNPKNPKYLRYIWRFIEFHRKTSFDTKELSLSAVSSQAHSKPTLMAFFAIFFTKRFNLSFKSKMES